MSVSLYIGVLRDRFELVDRDVPVNTDINLDLHYELVDTQASLEEDESPQTVPDVQYQATGSDTPQVRRLFPTSNEEEISEPSYAQRLRASRHGFGYSQSHRLLAGSFPLHMSIVTEGTPEDEQSSRNQTSCLRSSNVDHQSPLFHRGGSFEGVRSLQRSLGQGSSTSRDSHGPPEVELVEKVERFMLTPATGGTKLT